MQEAWKWFIDQCVNNPERPEKPIKRQIMRTFATEGRKFETKQKKKKKKKVQFRMEWDLFEKVFFSMAPTKNWYDRII